MNRHVDLISQCLLLFLFLATDTMSSILSAKKQKNKWHLQVQPRNAWKAFACCTVNVFWGGSKVNCLSALNRRCSSSGNADSLNPGKQKVIDLLQGRKFRGLDEYTFGPAVAAALKAGNKARSQQHSAVNTPCARTPDSMLSEASDLCCLGGSLCCLCAQLCWFGWNVVSFR